MSFLPVLSRDLDPIKLDKQAAKFDRAFSRLVEKYEIRFDKLNTTISKYNELAYPASDKITVLLSGVLSPEAAQRTRESVWPIYERYLGSVEGKKIADLRNL